MAVDRTIWGGSFDENAIPSFPCPHCENGRVLADLTTLQLSEPKYSALAHQHEAWEPDWEVKRFSLALRCPEPKCGELVIVSGDNEWVETHDDDFGWGLMSTLRPRSIFPPPPVIRLPDNLPGKIEHRIKNAFSLLWIDLDACANSLRISVELLLDHLNIPRTTLSRKGKTVALDLNGRIQAYEQVGGPTHAETFQALRMVGNLGSHGESVNLAPLLDVFELYEDALSDIIGGRPAYLAALKKRIIASKGRPQDMEAGNDEEDG